MGVSAVRVPLTGNDRPVIQNLGTGIVYWGRDSTVTTGGDTGGIRLAAGATYEWPADLDEGTGALWLISDTASTDVRYDVVG